MAQVKYTFVEVTTNFWVPEKVGEKILGWVLPGGEVETQHGTADYMVIKHPETGEEKQVIVGGGLTNLPKQLGKLAQITFEGEKENPNPKKGRSKMFKAFKLEVAEGLIHPDYENA